MNLANLGLSGINAAQNRLATAGHNINNVDTAGYNRQTVLSATAGATGTYAGYIGRGVEAVTVQRSYDSFLYRQLVSAQTTGASLVAYGNEIGQINDLFADPTVGIAPALQKFFDSIEAVASAPADPAARQEMLGRANSLVGQLSDANAFLDSQRGNLNAQISTTVTQINSYAERVRDLNQQIATARATTPGHEPNDLLDLRDQLVSELSQLVEVDASEQNGSISLSVGNGQMLLSGDTVHPLSAQPSADDPSRVVIAYSTKSVTGAVIKIEMAEDAIKGGKLGGLMEYRREALDSVQNDLGRMAVGLVKAFNAIHSTGVDLSGDPAGDFFRLDNIAALPGTKSTGTAQLNVTFADANQLTAQDYRVEFNGTQYTVTSIPNGTVSVLGENGGTKGTVDGITFDFGAAGTPAPGDSWLVQPTRAAAKGLEVAIDDPAKIAASKPNTGTANGDVALALGQLRTNKVLGNGSMSLNESFSKLVNNVGVMTQQNGTSAKAQAALIQQNFAAQQSLSGVNLDEEKINLDRYQQQFRAASQLIEVSATLFDTLLGLRT